MTPIQTVRDVYAALGRLHKAAVGFGYKGSTDPEMFKELCDKDLSIVTNALDAVSRCEENLPRTQNCRITAEPTPLEEVKEE